jgi:hypothetical protein
MKKFFLTDEWEYEIIKNNWNKKEYGYKVDIYKNNFIIKSQKGFGSIGTAESWARNYFLLEALGIDLCNYR